LAARTDADLGWVPRRAGDRGAVEAGLLPSLLPGGRPVEDAAARVDTAAIWGVADVPETPGRDLPAMLQAIEQRALSALVVAGAQLDDLPEGAEAALRAVDHLVVLDTHRHALVELAHVVFPVAAVSQKAGTFLNWEGRERPSARATRSTLMPDARVLGALAAELGADLALADAGAIRAQLAEFAGWEGARAESPDVPAPAVEAGAGLALATWRPLIGGGTLEAGEPYLAATAPPQQVWLSADMAARVGAKEGDLVTVTGRDGSVAAPLVVTEVAADTVVVTGDAHRALGVGGERVRLAVGGLG
jgi:NADH-quinone oxidoreductase subunit G